MHMFLELKTKSHTCTIMIFVKAEIHEQYLKLKYMKPFLKYPFRSNKGLI